MYNMENAESIKGRTPVDKCSDIKQLQLIKSLMITVNQVSRNTFFYIISKNCLLFQCKWYLGNQNSK